MKYAKFISNQKDYDLAEFALETMLLQMDDSPFKRKAKSLVLSYNMKIMAMILSNSTDTEICEARKSMTEHLEELRSSSETTRDNP